MLRGISGEGGDTLPKDAQGQGKRQQTSCLGKFCLYIRKKFFTVGRVITEIVQSRGGNNGDIDRAILSGRNFGTPLVAPSQSVFPGRARRWHGSTAGPACRALRLLQPGGNAGKPC